jgi:hypothetical protein
MPPMTNPVARLRVASSTSLSCVKVILHSFLAFGRRRYNRCARLCNSCGSATIFRTVSSPVVNRAADACTALGL